MKVSRFETFVVSNDVSPRTGVSIAYVSSHSYALIKLTDADGTWGWGETYATPGTIQAIEAVASSLIGHEGSLRSLIRETRWQAGGITGGGFAHSAAAIALEDLRARQLGVPIHAMYAGPVRNDVRAYAASGGYTEGIRPDTTWPSEVERAQEAGFTALKFRIGRYPITEEAPLLERVRESVPAGFDLMADGNAAYMLPRAIEMGRILSELGFRWYEEPMEQRGGYVSYPELTARLDVPVAAGEALVTRADAQRFLSTRCADIVQPDPVICGGVGEVISIAEMAAANGIMATPHTSNSAIGITAAIHALACIADPTRAEHATEPLLEFGIDGSSWRTELLVEPHTMSDGRIAVPDGAGLGVEIDENHLRKVAVYSNHSDR